MVNSCRKGKRGEREVVRLLRKIFPNIKRNIVQAREGGVDLINCSPLNIEIKTGKQANIKKIRKWLNQVKEEGRPENFDLIIANPDREDWWIVMPFDDLIELLELMKKEGVI